MHVSEQHFSLYVSTWQILTCRFKTNRKNELINKLLCFVFVVETLMMLA